MPAKKTEPTSLEAVVSVPATTGVNLNNVYATALRANRNQVPLTAVPRYDVVKVNPPKGKPPKDGHRDYTIRISWGDRTIDDSDGSHQYDALAVPTALPDTSTNSSTTSSSPSPRATAP